MASAARRPLSTGLLASAAGALAAGACGILVMPMVISRHGVGVWGDWAIFEAVVSVLAPLGLMGAQIGIVKQIGYDRRPVGSTLLALLSTFCPFLILGFLALAAIGVVWGLAPVLGVTFAGVAFLESTLLLLMSGFRGGGLYWRYSILQAVKALAFLGGAACLPLSVDAGEAVAQLAGARLGAAALALIIGAGLVLPFVQIGEGMAFDASRALARDAVTYGAPIYMMSLMQTVMESSDRGFLAIFSGSIATGEYVSHAKLVGLLSLGVIGPFSMWWGAERYRLLAKPEFGRVAIARIAWLWLLVLSVLAVATGALSPVLMVWLAPGVRVNPEVLALLLAAAIAGGMAYPLNNAALLPGRTMMNVWVGLFATLFNLILCAALVPNAGAEGAAVAAFAGNAVLVLGLFQRSQREFAIPVSGPALALAGGGVGLLLWVVCSSAVGVWSRVLD